MRCTSISVHHGHRSQCIRELTHPGDCAYGAPDGLFDVACDACGLPVLEPGLYRHPSCAPPGEADLYLDEIRHTLEARRNAPHRNPTRHRVPA